MSRLQKLMICTSPQVSTPSALFSLGPQAFVSTFSDFISGVLEVNDTNVDVNDYVLAPRETVTQSDAPVKMQVQFSVGPAATGGPQHVRLGPPLHDLLMSLKVHCQHILHSSQFTLGFSYSCSPLHPDCHFNLFLPLKVALLLLRRGTIFVARRTGRRKTTPDK